MKKKIKISLILSLAIIFGCFSNVFAATNQNNKADKISQVRKNARFLQSASTDDGVVGTSNLNGTTNNSAKVGDSLTSPEIGWKRYDNTSNKIIYTGTWTKDSSSGLYNNTGMFIPEGTSASNINSSYILFKFYGKSIRIIESLNPQHTKDERCSIDGIEISSGNDYNTSIARQVIIFQQTDLKEGIHTIKVYSGNGVRFDFDAIDIDSTGYLIDPSSTLATGISLNKTTDSLILNDSIKGTDTLIATVTPDNATNKTVNWTSSDPTVVSVDANGNITALKAGTATITATIDGTNLSASCTVTVTEPSNNRATLTINMVNGSSKQYDLSASELSDFLSWYNGMTNPLSSQCYTFNNPITGPYLNNKDYIPFNKIDDFKVQEYTK